MIGTRGFIDQFGAADGIAFPIKLAGSFCDALAFMLIYTLLTDIARKSELFTYGFVQATPLAGIGYNTVNGPWAEVEEVVATKEAYIAPAIFAFLNAVVLYTGADVIYA